MTDYPEFYKRHLPHWQLGGATLFVTFRLAGSMPVSVIAALKEQQAREQKALLQIDNEEERWEQAYQDGRRAFRRWDAVLDASATGPRWLAQPQIPEIVVEALHYRDERAYDLYAFCVMPNHVHLVCTPLAREDGICYSLTRVLQSLKRYTARQANQVLGREGAFWQAESYDHVIRDEGEFERIVRYVVENPVKAGLVGNWEDWPWTYLAWSEIG